LAFVSPCEIKYIFYNYLTLSAGYTSIRTGNNSGIYAAIIPAAEAEMCTDLYREDAEGCAIKLRYKREKLFFHARGLLLKPERKGRLPQNHPSASFFKS
jgi:hypothetical protein